MDRAGSLSGAKPGRRRAVLQLQDDAEFHIDDLEATRQGVSAYENQCAGAAFESLPGLYAAGETQKIFAGCKVHILSNGQVISDV